MAELIDIYDANLIKIGSADRVDAHMNGDWHRTFHLWIASPIAGGSVLFQLRSPTAKNYPDLLDITAAGHLMSGEDVKDGLREVSEELGIDVAEKHLHWLGYRVEVADQDNGQRNREYQAVFLLKDNRELVEFRPDHSEVYGLLPVPIRAGMDLFSENTSSIRTTGIAYDALATKWKMSEQLVTKDRFLPRIQNYYLTIMIMAERLLEGRTILAIS